VGRGGLISFHAPKYKIEARVHFHEEQWVLFRSFDDAAAARGMCLWLTNEQISARVERNGVFILKSLEDRAEWIVGQLPPTREDLLSLLAAAAT
jgi:hypothetical protein